MPLTPLPTIDTRRFFRPAGREILTILEALPSESWDRPTVAGSWLVRDVVAHLADTALRRLSLQRDGQAPPAVRGGRPPGESEIAAMVNGMNARWIDVARRFSPRVLTELYRTASEGLADFFETVPLDAPALFPVSWAGEQDSAGWFDIAREFTEQWHHGSQIREAVEAPRSSASDPAWLRAVLETAVRGLPHAYRRVPAAVGTRVRLEISGPSGGIWTLRRESDRWSIWVGTDAAAAGTVSVSDENAGRLFFNALPPEDAKYAVRTEGEAGLTTPFLAARSVIL